jgi:hypothetical protein
MSELQGNQESSDEFNEGTATYAEVRTLEALRAGGFTPALVPAQDPYYSGFRNIESLVPHYERRLLKDAADAEYPGSKGYTYGCFQALLCQRLYPGWQQAVVAGSGFMDKELAKHLPISEEEKPQIEKRLRETYPVTEIRERNARFLNARDDAYRKLRNRSGRIYVLDFKPTRQYMSSVVGNKGAYRLGLIGLYPGGLGPVQFDEVELSRIAVPAEVNQLYYIRTVDPSPRRGEAPIAIDGARQADGSWKAATVRTPLFTLKAPHVRVKPIGNLIKIQVLARVK